MATWQFRGLNPNDNSGVSTVEDNFANEDRTSVEILVRETLQNPLDARCNDELVEVRYNLVSLQRSSSKFLQALFPDECVRHFEAGGLIGSNRFPETIELLIIEDFGTTGLEGCYTDSSLDGQAENWNAFWFREGEGAKPTRSNGGAGQGKITLYAMSSIRSVFAVTRRASDQKELAFGCCRFRRNYKLPGATVRWAKEARWGSTGNPDELALPIEDSAFINAIKDELGLLRDDRSGTSFIVPLPIGAVLFDFKKAVLNEFFVPIRRGRLKVTVGDTVIDSDSVSELTAGLGPESRYPKDYRAFLEGAVTEDLEKPVTATAKSSWAANSKLTAEHFDPAELETLKTRFEASETVCVEFPVRIRKIGHEPKTGRFKVFLAQDLDGDQSHELFVRQDLGIDGEKRLKGSRRIQPVFALTFIDDVELSAFLVAAEEPTHRTWNASRPKVKAMYEATQPLMNALRNAALRLVEFLTPAGKRDTAALALYFADPNTIRTKQKGAKGVTSEGDRPDGRPFEDIPPPKVKAVEFKALESGFQIRVAQKVANELRYPLSCDVRTAYATTFGDPFKQWDAAEFWLNDTSEFQIEMHKVSQLIRDGNELHFDLDSPDSEVKLTGFDMHRKVEVQINYREAEDAEDFADN